MVEGAYPMRIIPARSDPEKESDNDYYVNLV
jgi:hypothetical protein